MAKVMLVEDDNSLREIYEARLAAEGYTIVAAQDGEEALALAVKERPDLIIADIMMPKVSGFDMLDILRSTPETKNAKIIMMTALSQAEDKTRAESLGADRYLVKSQVTLEDIVKVAAEMLTEAGAISGPAAAGAAPTAAVPATPPAASPTPSVSLPAPVDAPSATPSAPSVPATPVPAPEPTPEPSAPAANIPVAVAPAPQTDQSTSSQPIQATTGAPGLVEEELTPEPSAKPVTPAETAVDALSTPSATEGAAVSEQIEQFIANNPTLTTSDVPAKDTASATPAPASAPEAPKTTSIPVTVADDDEKTDEKPADAPDSSDADKTMADALSNLAGAPRANTKLSADTSDKKEDEDDKPQLAPKRGGERIITPITDPKDTAADLQKLLAKEPDEDGSAPLAANSVIDPDGKVTSPEENSTPAVQSFDQPAGDVNVATPPETAPEDSNPNNIAL